jgi:hypothetical protein
MPVATPSSSTSDITIAPTAGCPDGSSTSPRSSGVDCSFTSPTSPPFGTSTICSTKPDAKTLNAPPITESSKRPSPEVNSVSPAKKRATGLPASSTTRPCTFLASGSVKTTPEAGALSVLRGAGSVAIVPPASRTTT